MPQACAYIWWYVSRNSRAARVHNAHAPIVIKLDCFLQPFAIETLGLCRRLAYLMLVVGIYFSCIELPGWNHDLNDSYL